jgi:WD40 repeat protein
MENNELINTNISYSPCILKNCTFGNLINGKEIEIFVSGTNKTKTKSFLHYFTYDFNSKDKDQKKESTILFQTWNDTPSKTINYIIPIRINNSQNESQNNLLSSGAFIFSSQLELLLNKDDDYNLYLIDDDLYIKPNIENDIIYGLVLDIGLKIFDLAKKEIKSILYPGKKHVINDYFISSDNKNIIFACEDRKIYVYDKTDGKSFISRPNKMEINQVCEGSNDGKKFYAYSDEDYTLYLYDIRNFNQFVDVVKQDIEITKMIYNKACQKLFFLEFGSEAIISIDKIKQESIYESHKIIKDFGFQEQQKFMNLITEDNSINIISL